MSVNNSPRWIEFPEDKKTISQEDCVKQISKRYNSGCMGKFVFLGGLEVILPKDWADIHMYGSQKVMGLAIGAVSLLASIVAMGILFYFRGYVGLYGSVWGFMGLIGIGVGTSGAIKGYKLKRKELSVTDVLKLEHEIQNKANEYIQKNPKMYPSIFNQAFPGLV